MREKFNYGGEREATNEETLFFQVLYSTEVSYIAASRHIALLAIVGSREEVVARSVGCHAPQRVRLRRETRTPMLIVQSKR